MNQIEALMRVECDAHAKRPRYVATFIKTEGRWDEAWGPNDDGPRVTVHLTGRHAWGSTGQPVDLSRPGLFSGVPYDLERLRYAFECPAHRAGRLVVTDPEVQRIFEGLHELGRAKVTLGQLGAIVSSS